MEEFIAQNLSFYGPVAVFFLLMLSGVGIPVGEDLVIIPAGVLVGHDHLQFWPVAVFAYFGVVMADCLWFGICHHYGTPLLHKRWFKRLLHPRRMLEAKHQFEQRGVWLIVAARFIPTSRTSAVTAAGMLHMPFWKFLIAEATCVLFTVPLQIGIGVLISHGIGSANAVETLLRVFGLTMIVVAAMILVAWLQGYRQRKKRLPRAKAAWLRRFRSRLRRQPAEPKEGDGTGASDGAHDATDAPPPAPEKGVLAEPAAHES